ncbi:PREDICTED: uncharacterized protein LOC108787092 [Nanorana parkeri]|uniref:uncharacterized protein LOC108787092 n=1 Tax=Nanorana parkeri TaxID=125878 RepID=UPI0008546BAE|nr:PREDICTED: uncharacterized protein LOC108787092 [Nanorana parkeri]
MQMLNDRLSSYLDKVSALEQENAQLERNISEWYANNAPSSLPDSSQYFRIISDLQSQIAAATMENARIVLQIDNARLTADDFREKYEMELSISNNTEADINALRRVLEGLNRDNCDLEMQVQNLQEELQEMKRNHEEEANCLRAQLGARVNVELNAAPSIDLNRALTEIRDEYENLMERNLSDVEDMFRQRSEELNRQVTSGSEQLQSVQTEVIELNRTIQTLEIELQSQMSMTTALESTLAETQATYNSQIAQLQAMINNVECQLTQIRSDLERQNYEYKILMDQKTHLEMEIATYKRLLDGHNIHVSDYGMSSGKHGWRVTEEDDHTSASTYQMLLIDKTSANSKEMPPQAPIIADSSSPYMDSAGGYDLSGFTHSIAMNHREKYRYSLARSYKNISRMGSPVLQMSSRPHHGCLTRFSHGGCSKSTGQSQFFYYGELHESHHRRSYMYDKVDSKAFGHGSSKAFLHSGHHATSYGCKALQDTKNLPVSHGYNVHCHNTYLRNSREYDKCKNHSIFDFNQKKTMIHLNERLSSYLEKVHSLEQDKERFEKKIAKWYENNAPGMPADLSKYFKTIQELQNQISTVFTNNVGIIRNIDNARMAVDEYNNKYEVELILKTSIDADVNWLHAVLDGFNDQSVKLDSEADKLQQEMLKIRRDSEQDINFLTSQLGTRVSVEVEVSASADLNNALSGIREEYEELMEKNLRKIENLFLQRSEKLNQKVTSGSEQLQSAHTELIDVKHSLQTLEIELQREQYMISTLEETLAEKQAYYVSELAQLQGVINSVESQLDQIRTELESQIEEYQLLMDKKTHLEQEISTYQYLMDGHGINLIGQPPFREHIEQSSNDEQKDNETADNMSHNARHCYSSAGSHMGSHRAGGPHSGHATSHHGGSHTSHHGGSSMSHHGGSHMSHHGGHHTSDHGGHHISNHGGHRMSSHGGHRMSSHGGHHMSHHGGSQMLLHGGHHIYDHGGSHISHNGGQNTSHHGGHHMSHHGGSHMSSLGDHHTSHHGGHRMSSLGGSHMLLHGDNHISHLGGSHMSHNGGQNTSHHGGHHMSQHGGSNMSSLGDHHMSHHGGSHTSLHGGSHMSRHESHHTSHPEGSQLSHHGGSHMSSYGGHNMSHHGNHHISHHEGDNTSHNEGHHRSHHGGSHGSHHGSNHMSQHGGHCVSHHGSHHKKEVSFSKHVGHSHEGHHSSSGGHGGWKRDSLLGVNEKEIMQLLNERLSSYLTKVRSLEMENAQLDRKIFEWYASYQPKTPPDGTHYYRLIDELQNKIAEAAIENAWMLLETDNARLAADDYKTKLEMEQTLASNVEMDIQKLERVLEGLWGEAAERGMQVRSLQEERDCLRNNSEEVIESLLSQLGARINVELNAAPSIDLNEALSEIREEYESLMERNLGEAANMFLGQSEELTREMEFGSEELQSIETELIELKRCMQALEIELQSELSLKSALEGTLAEMEATFGSKLAKLQCLINGLESDLAQIRSDLERQNHEYRTLMDQKNHLEMEIATYKRLLDGHDIE